MTQVIHAAPEGDVAFLARCLDTGEEAIVTTATSDRDRIADWCHDRRVEGSQNRRSA